jgi:hypothetical protein
MKSMPKLFKIIAEAEGTIWEVKLLLIFSMVDMKVWRATAA